MSKIFKEYAKYYDFIYKDKDYKKECAFVEQIFKKYALSKLHSILDMACGTGGHAIPLAKKGYRIVGIDMSEPMIDIAREKSKQAGLAINFYTAEMQKFRTLRKFDAVILLFASIDYLRNSEDLKNTLSNISKSLKRNGLFIFDFWNGLAVMHDFVARSSKIMRIGDMTIKRQSIKHLNSVKQTCEVNFKFLIYKQKKLIDHFCERHIIRYFFSEEMRNYLELTGFKVIKVCPFLKLNKEISQDEWDITMVARRP